jgi:cytochrome c553
MMRRITVAISVALVVFVASIAVGQDKKMSLEEYSAVMKSNAQANGALNKAIGSGAYADARTQVGVLRKNLASLRPFWAERKRDDAVAILQTGETRLASLDALLGQATVPQADAQAAAKEFAGAVCAACHKQNRDGDNQTGFKFKEGVF